MWDHDEALREARRTLHDALRDRLQPFVPADHLDEAVAAAERPAWNFGGTFHSIEDRQRVRDMKDQCDKGGDCCS